MKSVIFHFIYYKINKKLKIFLFGNFIEPVNLFIIHFNMSIHKYFICNEVNIIMVSGSGGGIYGPGFLYNYIANTVNSSNIYTIDAPSPINNAISKLNKLIKKISNENNLPYCFIGWSMGSATIVQSIKMNFHIHNRINTIIFIAPQTSKAIEISEFEFDFELLIIHGTNDNVINTRSGKHIYNIVPTKKKYLICINGADHCMFSEKFSKLLIDIVFDFFNKIIFNKMSNIQNLPFGIYYV